MRKDPTEFRKRFAAWKNGEKVYKDGLPAYRGGKQVLNNYTNAEFNDDGTFTDDTTRVFDDFYVTPSGVKTKYGSYTDKNWDRYKQQEQFFKTHDQQTGKLRYEPGLEIVSPEFDLLTGIRGILNNVPTKNVIDKYKNFTDAQWDNMYNRAIKSGNIEDIQKLRDLHFKIKAPKNIAVDENGNPIRTYHTVGDQYNPNFNEFDPNIEGTHSAIYTSNDPMMSGTYSSYIVSNQELQNLAELMRLNEINNIAKGYTKGGLADLRKAILSDPERGREYIIRNTWLNQQIQPLRQKQLYTNIENPVIINQDGRAWNNISLSELKDNYPDVFKEIKPGGELLSNSYTTRSLEAAQKAAGYDGAIIKNVLDYGGSRKSTILDWAKPNDVYMTNSPYKVKLADAITYDDNGKIIPLSKRDNFNIADIRYGIIPLISGGTGYGLYNTYAE